VDVVVSDVLSFVRLTKKAEINVWARVLVVVSRPVSRVDRTVGSQLLNCRALPPKSRAVVARNIRCRRVRFAMCTLLK